jgi:glycosyltransferase involved in cell wall biosynthesis
MRRRSTSSAKRFRYVVDPPVFSTARLRVLSHVPDHTDLTPFHPRLARMLPRYDVIHTTDAYFAYARTALRIGRWHGIPIVNSVHTNTPEYARLFTGRTIERMLGHGATAQLLLDRLAVARRVEQRMLAQLLDYQRHCAFTLVSRPEQLDDARARLGGRAGLLRRGVDHRLFNPAMRDRPWLASHYGIPPERFVVICAGRLNRGKNILFLAETMAAVITEGIDAQPAARRLPARPCGAWRGAQDMVGSMKIRGADGWRLWRRLSDHAPRRGGLLAD